MKVAIILILAAAIVGGVTGPAPAADAFADGLELFNAGSWTQAAARLLVAAAQVPSDVVVRLTTGVALANVKRYAEALEQFKAAARLSPGDALPQFLLDGAYSELGNVALSRQARFEANRMLTSKKAFGGLESSDQALLASLEKYPKNSIAYCLLGDVYQLQGKLAPAKQQYKKSSELAGKWAKPVFNLGLANLESDPKAAEESFGRVIQMDPSNSRAYLWQGDVYLRQRRYAEAVAAYQNAAKDKALAAEARTRMGNAQMQAGDFSAASEQFDLAAQQNPRDPRPLAGKAQVLQNTGRLEEAAQKYQQAAEIMMRNDASPSSQALVQNQMADVNAQMGYYDEAASNLQVGFELQPTKANADTLTRTQQKTHLLSKGIADNEAAMQKNPRDTQAMLYLLSAYKLKRNYVGEIDIATRLVRSDPANAPAYYAEIGAAWMCLGDAENAVEAYSRALELGSSVTWSNTARSARQAGALGLLRERYDKAFAASGKTKDGMVLFDLRCAQGDARGMVDTGLALVKSSPDEPTFWLRLGEAYERVGSAGLAQIAYSKAASGSNPEAASAARARLEVIRGNAGKGTK